MAFDDPIAITGLPLSALEGRRGQAALLAHTDDALSALPGVLHGLGCTVSGLTLTAAVGSAILSPSTGANGSYLAVNQTASTATFTAQDATYARIDRVVLRLYDNEVDASGQSKAAVEIIAGTPSATPTAPTLPTGRLELYQAQVPKNGSGAITLVDKRSYAASAGGIVVAQSYATLPAGSFLRPGQRGFTLDGLVSWRWTGAAWRVDGVPEFATTTARDTAIPSPAAGDRCIVGTGATWTEYLYGGATAAWRPWSADIADADAYTWTGGFSAWVTGWSGVKLSLRGGICNLSGAFGASSWSAGAVPLTVSAPFRPRYPVYGSNCEIRTNGTVAVVAAGSVAGLIAVSWPVSLA